MKLKIKPSKKIIIPVAIVAAIGIAAAVIAPKTIAAMGKASVPVVSAAALERMDLANNISVTGTVKSEDETNVYSTLSYQVKLVNVKVGDTVSEGDVLCELDTEKLTQEINQTSASIASSQAKANHSLAVAQNQLATEQYNQEYEFASKQKDAEDAVVKAEQGLETAKLGLADAEATLNAARTNLREYRDEYGIGSSNVDELAYEPKTQYNSLVQAVEKARNGVEKADQEVEKAKKALEDAKKGLTAAKALDQEKVISTKDQVDTAQLGTNLADQWMKISDMKKDLDKAIIKAPVSGVVTAVLAKEGGSGQGLLFVIEDTTKLKIDTKIKEYDIAAVKVGLPAKIKSDGTGDDEYTGKVSRIAPTAIKNETGSTVETTDVQFATEISVDRGSNLRIGMNARLDIVTQEKKNVFAVPYEAVVENENGEMVVFVARTQQPDEAAEGDKNAVPTAIAVAVPVEMGLETDFYVEITSPDLQEGDMVITEPASLVDGQQVMIADALGAVVGGAAGGGPRMAVRMGG